MTTATEYYSTLTCPFCEHHTKLEMPIDSCLILFKCENCSKIIKPFEGDCCVFCSYGSVKCPSMQ